MEVVLTLVDVNEELEMLEELLDDLRDELE